MSFVKDLFNAGEGTVKTPAQARVTGISTPGSNLSISGSPENTQVSLSRTPATQNLIDSLGAGRTAATGGLNNLLDRTQPGFSDLRASRLTGVENARTRSISNLRENLGRRNVLGSSFAGDALTRADLGFQEEADRVRAETGLQEIGVQSELINQRLQSELSTIQAELQQFNEEARLAGNISAQELQAAQNNARLASEAAQFNAQLEAQNAAGLGNLIGDVVGFGAERAFPV